MTISYHFVEFPGVFRSQILEPTNFQPPPYREIAGTSQGDATTSSGAAGGFTNGMGKDIPSAGRTKIIDSFECQMVFFFGDQEGISRHSLKKLRTPHHTKAFLFGLCLLVPSNN